MIMSTVVHFTFATQSRITKPQFKQNILFCYFNGLCKLWLGASFSWSCKGGETGLILHFHSPWLVGIGSGLEYTTQSQAL